MLANFARNIPKLSRSSYRITSGISRRAFGLGDQLNKRKKVEEDLYMRQQTEAWKDKLRILRAEEEVAKAEALHVEVVDPVKEDIASMLAKTGDKVSDAGLETLANWKLSL